eukprot:TRINITY_DN50064_c0_g1_i1.p1 TRINITY_DN50064_c0_g1~~TRINITY_DN50064_c0_g1_i1.p1  ORF type:complete len:115 (-),score=15.64 TRINITY_DN50064_c0_g1_i1:20-364(-)
MLRYASAMSRGRRLFVAFAAVVMTNVLAQMTPRPSRQSMLQDQERYQHLFSVSDVDKDGRITRKEAIAIATKRANTLMDGLNRDFAEFDQDHDDRLSKTEFIRMVMHNRRESAD